MASTLVHTINHAYFLFYFVKICARIHARKSKHFLVMLPAIKLVKCRFNKKIFCFVFKIYFVVKNQLQAQLQVEW